jgi:peroxiredoxin
MKRLFTYPIRIFALICIALMMSASTGSGYKIGDEARDFELRNVDGKMVSLSDYQDAKGYIVIFTCNTCPYSKMYEDRIIALHDTYASKGYPVVAINPNDPGKQPGDSYDEMIKRSESKSFPFAYLVDETQEIARAYGATRTPHVFLLQKENGKNIVKYIGAIDNNSANADAADQKYVETAIGQVISGKKVSQNFTKAIGCTIKWKES